MHPQTCDHVIQCTVIHSIIGDVAVAIGDDFATIAFEMSKSLVHSKLVLLSLMFVVTVLVDAVTSFDWFQLFTHQSFFFCVSLRTIE